MNRISSLTSLHPKFRPIAEKLHKQLIRGYETGLTEFRFEIFETLRLPEWQEDAFKRGVSKARAWQSPHQYGLACDFVPTHTGLGTKLNPAWHWPDAGHPDWDFLTKAAHVLGLVTISWDRPHVEHPIFEDLRRVL